MKEADVEKHRSLEDRFWEKVDRRGPDDCWLWTAAHLPGGYGLFRVQGERWMQRAHRVAWILTYGAITAGMFILHSCDNPACVNPGHLREGTNADNMADKVARGRSHVPQPNKRGALHPMARLTQRQVDEMRARSTRARGEGRRFASEYGVSPATVSLILSGRLWSAS